MNHMQAEGWHQIRAGRFMTSIGPVWRRQIADGYEYGLQTRVEHANALEIVHGGVIMTFADYAIGMAAMEQLEGERSLVTAQLDVHFISSVKAGALLTGHSEVVRRTSSLFFLRGTLKSDQQVANASGVTHNVKLPRRRRPASYAGQFLTLYFIFGIR